MAFAHKFGRTEIKHKMKKETNTSTTSQNCPPEGDKSA